MAAIRKLGMRTGKARDAKELVLECQVSVSRRHETFFYIIVLVWQGSSLGSSTTQWLNEFHWSARGESAEDWLDKPKKSREKLPYPPIKIVFPTKATVQESALGEMVCIVSLLEFRHSHLGLRVAGQYFAGEISGMGKTFLGASSMILRVKQGLS